MPDDAASNEMHSELMWKGPAKEASGESIGPYRLLEEIGEGGFGVVWLAERREPMVQRVALKIIKPGMDSREVVGRFELERQALAVMDHPSVAKVFDGGVTPSGRPYFVMEHVKGEPITAYADRRRLSIRERLELFVAVCDAVQHAHTKGIIHRDIKPSNVLVTEVDGRPTPKVIDFGVAKAIGRSMTDGTVFTETGRLIGTPEYMSPEQAELGAVDVDTRTDVYSLGVLLYELLAGAAPFDAKTLRAAGFNEIQRIIREVDPPRPSTKLASAGGASTTIAEARRADPRLLSTVLRGELDWVVMKCLEKDRVRRYETPNALAVELERYLGNRPVLARPQTAAYRLRKFVRRRRGPVAAGVAMLLLLVTGIAGTSLFALRAHVAAALAATEAEKARAAEAAAEARAQELEEVASFQESQLSGIDTALMGVRLREAIESVRRDASVRSGAPPEVVEKALDELEAALEGVNFTDIALESLEENIFDRAIAAIKEDFKDRPAIRARLLRTVGSTLKSLGLHQGAGTCLRAALETASAELGPDHLQTYAAANSLGLWLSMGSEHEEAVRLLTYASEGMIAARGPEDPETLRFINNLAMALHFAGRTQEAEIQMRTVLERRRRLLGDEHSDTLVSINNLASLLQDEKRLSEAEELYQESLEGRRRAHGADSLEALIATNNLVTLFMELRRPAEAAKLAEQVLSGRRRLLGATHPATLTAANNLGMVLRSLGRLDEAAPLIREAYELRRRTLGATHSATLVSLNNLGMLHRDRGDLPEAERCFGVALNASLAASGPNHTRTLQFRGNLADAIRSQGRLTEAEFLLRENVNAHDRLRGSSHPDTLRNLVALAEILVEQRKFESAYSLLAPTEHAARIALVGPYASYLTAYLAALGAAQVALSEYPAEFQAAESTLREAEARSSAAHKANQRRVCLAALVDLYTAWHVAEPSAGYDVKAAEWKAKLADAAPQEPAAAP